MKDSHTLIVSCIFAISSLLGTYHYKNNVAKAEIKEVVSNTPLIGEIILFGGNFAPRNWAFCEGQLLPIAQNTALFSILGTIYGGDGRTTFALPDLRGRVPIGAGRGPGLSDRRLGEKSGQETHTLTLLEIPSHNHTGTATFPVSTADAEETSPNGKYLAKTASPIYNEDPTAGQNTGAATLTINNNGSSQAHNNMMPWLGVNYIIALQGVYPSRN